MRHQGIRNQFGALIIQNFIFRRFFFGSVRLAQSRKGFRLSVRQFIDAMIEEMYLFGACSLLVKKLPSFWLVQTGKGNMLF